jgi:hypothetical protein
LCVFEGFWGDGSFHSVYKSEKASKTAQSTKRPTFNFFIKARRLKGVISIAYKKRGVKKGCFSSKILLFVLIKKIEIGRLRGAEAF